MSEPLISIIIPVYNAEQYIDYCIQSVIAQTYTNIEVLIVDDGSKDKSSVICDEYSKKDERIRVIHKENGGVSSARNVALELIRGEYVTFVDADDYMVPDYIEKMISIILEQDVDLVLCGYEKSGGINLSTGKSDKEFDKEKILLSENGIIGKEELWFHAIDSNIIGCYLWNKLLKKSLIQNLTFNEELSIGEDMVFLAQYLLNVKRAYYINEPLYVYRINESSALNSTDANKMYSKIQSAIKATELLENITLQEKDIKPFIAYRRVRTAVWAMFRLIISENMDRKVFKVLQSIIKDNYTEYKKLKYGSFIQNMAVIGICYVPRMVYTLGKVFKTLFPAKLYKLSRD